MHNIVAKQCPPNKREEASACLRQAHDFYLVGTEKGVEAARPLALYYCYMNLLKVYCLTWGANASFNNAQHGITEIFNANYEDIILRGFPSPNGQGKLQNFSELLLVLQGAGLPHNTDLRLGDVFPQILPGHRLWCDAANRTERFVALEDIQFWRNRDTREVWLRLYLFSDDLSRLGVTHTEFLNESGFHADFHEVACDREQTERKVICFEQVATVTYPDRHPADLLETLVSGVRHHLWATVTSIPPYRRYYAYLCPAGELASRLPQLLSIYAITYHLGSVTRYRPQDYDNMLVGKFGSRIQDFVTGQPAQFLYLLSSEIARQEITQPSII
ncbi:YaaC family protein [Psychromarinibacter sp. S121]|uniref:YaaC family protein n=1 Tax=Psychromarinibacter sp. S121 TaxID=3415127 RepID=UPI003C7C17CF